MESFEPPKLIYFPKPSYEGPIFKIEPLDQKIIVAKGTHSPRPAYEPIAKKMFWLASPGASTADLTNFTYKNRRVPMYPLEPETTWS